MRFLGGFATGSQSGMINKVAITSANVIDSKGAVANQNFIELFTIYFLLIKTHSHAEPEAWFWIPRLNHASKGSA